MNTRDSDALQAQEEGFRLGLWCEDARKEAPSAGLGRYLASGCGNAGSAPRTQLRDDFSLKNPPNSECFFSTNLPTSLVSEHLRVSFRESFPLVLLSQLWTVHCLYQSSSSVPVWGLGCCVWPEDAKLGRRGKSELGTLVLGCTSESLLIRLPSCNRTWIFFFEPTHLPDKPSHLFSTAQLLWWYSEHPEYAGSWGWDNHHLRLCDLFVFDNRGRAAGIHGEDLTPIHRIDEHARS